MAVIPTGPQSGQAAQTIGNAAARQDRRDQFIMAQQAEQEARQQAMQQRQNEMAQQANMQALDMQMKRQQAEMAREDRRRQLQFQEAKANVELAAEYGTGIRYEQPVGGGPGKYVPIPATENDVAQGVARRGVEERQSIVDVVAPAMRQEDPEAYSKLISGKGLDKKGVEKYARDWQEKRVSIQERGTALNAILASKIDPEDLMNPSQELLQVISVVDSVSKSTMGLESAARQVNYAVNEFLLPKMISQREDPSATPDEQMRAKLWITKYLGTADPQLQLAKILFTDIKSKLDPDAKISKIDDDLKERDEMLNDKASPSYVVDKARRKRLQQEVDEMRAEKARLLKQEEEARKTIRSAAVITGITKPTMEQTAEAQIQSQVAETYGNQYVSEAMTKAKGLLALRKTPQGKAKVDAAMEKMRQASESTETETAKKLGAAYMALTIMLGEDAPEATESQAAPVAAPTTTAVPSSTEGGSGEPVRTPIQSQEEASRQAVEGEFGGGFDQPSEPPASAPAAEPTTTPQSKKELTPSPAEQASSSRLVQDVYEQWKRAKVGNPVLANQIVQMHQKKAAEGNKESQEILKLIGEVYVDDRKPTAIGKARGILGIN